MTLKVVADGLAAQFVGITATNGTATEGLISAPTASLPNNIAAGPVLLVYHPVGVLDVLVSRIRQDVFDFPVKLLRDPSNYPDRSDWLYAWFDALRDRIRDGTDLGTGVTTRAYLTGARVELDGEAYAKVPFDVVELTYSVHVGGFQP